MAEGTFHIDGQVFEAPPLAPGLYLVATPIGHLADITLRALKTLAAADLILCEDTRTSATLLRHYGVATRCRAVHEHNERALVERLADEIAAGKALALISDAGTPLLSDPGFPLVQAVAARGLDVVPIPGASALLAALAGAGLPTDRFTFAGFPPAKSAARKTWLETLAERPETLVLYESPRRLTALLADLSDVFGGDRPAAVGRELTKKFETFARGTISELEGSFSGEQVRGEIVVLVGGAPERAEDDSAWEPELADRLASGEPLRQAVDAVAETHSVRRKKVYQRALAMRDATA